jgi:hypothetical protein
MRRNEKFYKSKEIRKIYNEYSRQWTDRYTHGDWVQVTPYQLGWTRYFKLRDDISRRSDADRIQTALDLVNTFQYCRNEKFVRRTHKKQIVVIEQDLKHLSVEQFEKLDPPVAKYFRMGWLYPKINRWSVGLPRPPYKVYYFKHSYWAVLHKDPNIITEQWRPDEAWERRMGELQLKIDRHNLWHKINRELGVSNKHKEWRLTPFLKNKRGQFIDTTVDYDELD